MPSYYVRSGAGGTADGSSWTNAYTTLSAAFAARAAGDTFYVAHDHAETGTAALTMTCPGTVAAPCYVICVDDGAEPPTTLATTATITTTTGPNYHITLSGCLYMYGVTLQCGTSTGASHIYLGTGTGSTIQVLDNCGLSLINTATSSRIYLGASSRDSMIKLVSCTILESSTGQRVLPRGRCYMYGGSLDTSVAIPTNFLNVEPGYGGKMELYGVNLSSLNTYLVISGNGSPYQFYFRNCRLHASVTHINTTAILSPGADQVFVENCDSGDTNYKLGQYKYEGSIVHETTIKRTSGASDGTTAYCWKMVSLATGPLFHTPLESPPIFVWNDSTGSAMTATVEIVHDSVTNLQDDEVWAEVEYLGTSGYTNSTVTTDRMTSIMATAADQTDSSEEWTTTGLSNPNTQKLVVTFTPQEKGPVIVRVMLAKANYTVYVCPKVAIA